MQIARWILFAWSVAGLLACLSLHAASWLGVEPEDLAPWVGVSLGVGIVPVFAPIVFREAERARRECTSLALTDFFPRWGLIPFAVVGLYVIVQFFVAYQNPHPMIQTPAEKHVASIDTFRLMTSGPAFFYLFCALYWGWNKRLRRSDQPMLRVRSKS